MAALRSTKDGNKPVFKPLTTALRKAVKKAIRKPFKASLKFKVNNAEKFILFIYLFLYVKSDDSCYDTNNRPNNLVKCAFANPPRPGNTYICFGCLNQDCIKLSSNFLSIASILSTMNCKLSIYFLEFLLVSLRLLGLFLVVSFASILYSKNIMKLVLSIQLMT